MQHSSPQHKCLVSSVNRAPGLQYGGRGFDHQIGCERRHKWINHADHMCNSMTNALDAKQQQGRHTGIILFYIMLYAIMLCARDNLCTTRKACMHFLFYSPSHAVSLHERIIQDTLILLFFKSTCVVLQALVLITIKNKTSFFQYGSYRGSQVNYSSSVWLVFKVQHGSRI